MDSAQVPSTGSVAAAPGDAAVSAGATWGALLAKWGIRRSPRTFPTKADLSAALQRGELRMHYQPKVSLVSGKVAGAEALLRWPGSQRGAVPPDVFVPLAEACGLIDALGEWVLLHVCGQLRHWLDAGLTVPPIALNLSAHQLKHGRLVSFVKRCLAGFKLEAARLDFEITESAFMDDLDSVAHTVRGLKALGAKVSLDDFGTGFSSLSHLKRFPVDELKIDRSFVSGIANDAEDAAICRAVIALAHSLELTVVAEGVETQAQMARLRDEHCDEMQGYYFCRPLPAAEFAQLLAANRRLAVH